MLNTAMAKGSYTMRDLQHRSDELTDTQDALRHTIDGLSGPGPLAKRARELGMVPAATPAFLRLSDGKVLGVAKKAKQDSTFSVVTEPTAPTRSTHVPTTPAARTERTRGDQGHADDDVEGRDTHHHVDQAAGRRPGTGELTAGPPPTTTDPTPTESP